MNGLNAVGALLPAVGMALLLQMLWSTELSIYFFLGFTLYQYLGLPMIAIAVLGVIIAIAPASATRRSSTSPRRAWPPRPFPATLQPATRRISSHEQPDQECEP